jgi:hypothetical protein
VDGCDNTKIRSRGLCNPHYLKWLRGSLQGFVGPEGHVMLEGVSRQVPQRFAAGRAEMKAGKLFVDGEAV